jgi:hypothetical protein
MKQAKAKNELAQLKSEDPLPLRRAKVHCCSDYHITVYNIDVFVCMV